MDKKLYRIAEKYFPVEGRGDLETHLINAEDWLDDVSVWGIKTGLTEAYNEGKKSKG